MKNNNVFGTQYLETDWSVLAQEYAKRGFPKKEWELGFQPVLDIVGDIKGKRVLDYGCGSGKFSRVLAAKGAKVIGLEPNEKMLDLAKEQDCTGIEYMLLQDNDLSEVGLVDLAVSTYVICGRESDAEAMEIFDNIYNSLPVRGSFILLDPHPDTRHTRILGQPNKITLAQMTLPLIDYWRPVSQYRAFFETAGFSIKELLETGYEKNKPDMLIIHGEKRQGGI